MEFYFDIEFLKALNSEILDEEIRLDFKKFIKNLYDVKCFVFMSHELLKSDLELIPFYDLITDISPVKVVNHNELNTILTDEVSTGFKYFFLNHIDTLNEIKDGYGYFCLNSSTLNEEWYHVESGSQENRKYISNVKSEKNFSTWSDLKPLFRFPVNSFIISDRYIFSEDGFPEYNILGLIQNIGLKPLSKRKVDILIACESLKSRSKKSNIQNSLNNKSFNDSFKLLKFILDKELGPTNYNLTFLETDKETIPLPLQIHFRTLWTNTMFLNPGSSFTFFRQDKKSKKFQISKGEYLNFDYFLWRRARHFEPIETIASAFQNIKNGIAIRSEPGVERVKVYGKKRCRLLNK